MLFNSYGAAPTARLSPPTPPLKQRRRNRSQISSPFPVSSSLPLWRTVLENWCQRPKGLFSDAEHVPTDIAEQGGLEEISPALVSLSACHNGGSFGNRVIHMLLYLRDEKKGSR